MAKKTIGYVELEWTCPNCGNKNPGLKKTCASCGAPQPQSAQFELGQQRDLITDAKKIETAAKGADIYCPFCNTRNMADAQTCVQCGGDLKEGLKRESGRVLTGGVVQPGAETKCAGCGTLNPATNKVCKACGAQLAQANPSPALPMPVQNQTRTSNFRPWMMLPIIAILCVVCVGIGYFFSRTQTLMGQVTDTQWQRTIAIEAQRQVTHETWRDQVPADAQLLGCSMKYHNRQDNPAPVATEVCSTETIDQGNGSAKVVETCYYNVYDDYCKYNVLEWQNIDQSQASGKDLQPYWPQVDLANAEREGPRSETYTVTFDTKDGQKKYTTSDETLYRQLQPGTEWSLVINAALGTIVEVSVP